MSFLFKGPSKMLTSQKFPLIISAVKRPVQCESLFLDLPAILWPSSFFIPFLSVCPEGAQSKNTVCTVLSHPMIILLPCCFFLPLSTEEWGYRLFIFSVKFQIAPGMGRLLSGLCVLDLTEDLHGIFYISYVFAAIVWFGFFYLVVFC